MMIGNRMSWTVWKVPLQFVLLEVFLCLHDNVDRTTKLLTLYVDGTR